MVRTYIQDGRAQGENRMGEGGSVHLGGMREGGRG